MRLGVPREIKNHEYRVGLVPSSVRELVARGHAVIVQQGAGLGAGLDDESYRAAGASVVPTAEEVFASSDMIVKVKEPQPAECARLRQGQILFTYLHLAPDPEQAQGLMKSGAAAVAYETVTDAQGGLPLLAPMSEVAGRMAIQAGAHFLEKRYGGRGVLLGGVPGVLPGRVVILGGGVVGSNAAQMAAGLGAEVVVLDKSLPRLAALDRQFNGRIRTLCATADAIESQVVEADLVVGAVLLPGASAPRLVTRALLKRMRPGAVIVDVAIDQGGCCETSRPTTHADPVFIEEGIVHYGVANMPGAVARTSTFALNNATLPYVLALADKGLDKALAEDAGLRNGLNARDGKIVHPAVAEALARAGR